VKKKNKKQIKVQDLKPRKDAKGGVSQNFSQNFNQNFSQNVSQKFNQQSPSANLKG
jgi:hypothetical protein